ncbi:MAG: DUF1304 family protein [Lachnospiraceae bacterium]|nr:DUF1304 family protein [Lachnospiraceae bacterium]
MLKAAKILAVLAANQGLYNGFLGLGIIFGTIRKNEVHCALDRIKT